jgi:hypothetical protein
MPVIVNEMEVVLSTEGGGDGMSAAPPPLPPPDPRGMAELLERRARNELRVFAH